MTCLNNLKVFVSGGAGVIGKPLVLGLIERGAEVFVGDLKLRPREFPPDVLYRQGDLNDLREEEVEEFAPNCFIHLAATFERSEESSSFHDENFHHNIRLSYHLLSIFKNLSCVETVLFASSYLVYDSNLYLFREPSISSVILTESSPIFPRNLIGSAKLAHEVELNFLKQFEQYQKRYIAARIFRGFGKGSRDVISRWVRSALKGEAITVYGQENRFDYIYASDTAEALISLMATAESSGVFNVSSGRSHTVKDVIEVLRSNFKDLKIEEHPTTVLRYETSEGDSSKIKNTTGWSARFSLRDAIEEIIEFERGKLEEGKQATRNVLITSISKKRPLIEAVKNAARRLDPCIEVHGSDADSKCLGRHFVDTFHIFPKDGELSFEFVARLCDIFNIGSIIPTRDGELSFYAHYKEEFAQRGVAVLISDLSTVNMCYDKILFSKVLYSEGFPVIPLVEEGVESLSTRFVVKESMGSGSTGLHLGVSFERAKDLWGSMERPLLQPFIEGREFSADVYVTQKKILKGVVLRWRDMVVQGESQVTTTFRDSEIEQQVGEVISFLGVVGHAVLQAIIDSNGQIHIIEVNCRFGGASTLSIAVGLDSFYWFLLESTGEDLDVYPYRRLGEKVLIRSPLDEIRMLEAECCTSRVL